MTHLFKKDLSIDKSFYCSVYLVLLDKANTNDELTITDIGII